MVECAGFQIGADPKMRSNRRHRRVMLEQCRSPRRGSGGLADACRAMEPEHTSALSNGAVSENHDDWCCVQDISHAGFFTTAREDLQPGTVLHFSDLGRAAVTALREFKAAGGTFSTLKLPADPPGMARETRSLHP